MRRRGSVYRMIPQRDSIRHRSSIHYAGPCDSDATPTGECHARMSLEPVEVLICGVLPGISRRDHRMAARNRLSMRVAELLGKQRIQDGGESGIRTFPPPLDSVSYRFHNATVAGNAGDAGAHCPPLPASQSTAAVLVSRRPGAPMMRSPTADRETIRRETVRVIAVTSPFSTNHSNFVPSGFVTSSLKCAGCHYDLRASSTP